MELRQWGWNIMTVGTVGTMFMLLLTSWGIWKQIRTIWRERSGESIAVVPYIFSFAYFWTAFAHGCLTERYAFIMNSSVNIPLFLTLLVSLHKFKGFRGWEKHLAVALFSILATLPFLTNYESWYFLGFGVASAIASSLQPWEIWNNRRHGTNALEIRMLVTGFVNSEIMDIFS